VSLLYEQVFQPILKSHRLVTGPIIEKSYNLLDPQIANPPFRTSMSIPSFGTYGGKIDSFVEVTWDPSKTTLNQALLSWSAHYFVGVYRQRSAEVRIYVNDVVVSARGWISTEGCITKGSEGTNIGGYLKNGKNKISIELVGSWSPEVSGVDAIRASFIAQFQGQEPTVKPPPPEWQKYVVWGILGIGGITAAYLGVKLITTRRQTKVAAAV